MRLKPGMMLLQSDMIRARQPSPSPPQSGGEGWGRGGVDLKNSLSLARACARGENSRKHLRIEPLNRSSRREEALTLFCEFQMEPPHVGCYELHGEGNQGRLRVKHDFGRSCRTDTNLCNVQK